MILIVLCHVLRWKYAVGGSLKLWETYRKVLSLDADNLAANIFIGNYLYLKAEREKKQLEADYKKISAPTREQYARYRDGLSRVMMYRIRKGKGISSKGDQSIPFY